MRYGNAELYNVVELEPRGETGGQRLCRIPIALANQLNENARNTSFYTTGCEIRCNLVGDSVTIVLSAQDVPGMVEVYWGPFFASSHTIEMQPTEITLAMPLPERHEYRAAIVKQFPGFDPALLRVILPERPPLRLHAIRGDIAPPRPEQTPARKLLAYGTSITQGAYNVRPTDPFAALTARLLGVDLINLGFSGGAHLEREIAEYIAARQDWDFAALELGRNLISRVDVAEFTRRVSIFVPTVANAHPDKWLFFTDVHTAMEDFGPESTYTSQVVNFRRIVREAIAALDRPKVVYVDGRDILRDATGLSFDLVHPGPLGMEDMGRNLAHLMRERMGDKE